MCKSMIRLAGCLTIVYTLLLFSSARGSTEVLNPVKALYFQLREIKGKVTDTAGLPLPSVSIQVLGATGVGTTTDVNGRFILQIPSKATLKFSYIGYQSMEIPVGERTELNIVMKEQGGLDEVVVVGFGTQKKVSLTGAISTISTQEILKIPAPSLSNAISGKVAGVIARQSQGEPGYDAAQILIRGMGTWANRNPLILVDGVERSMDNINAQEVENFSILKDASATAVYGVRGANGVILINTKRGKIGKPEITFRTETAQLHNLRMPEYINGFNYASLVNEALASSGKAPRYNNEHLSKFADGSDPFLYPSVDWTDVVMKKNTYQTINNLSINGGSSTIRYYTNVGYTKMNGIWKQDNLNAYNTNANMNRYNFRSNVDINVSSNLILELGIGGVIDQRTYPGNSSGGIFDALRTTSPIAFPVQNPDGTPGGVNVYVGSNPWGIVTQSGYSNDSHNTLQGTFGARWDLSTVVTKGLSLNGKFSFDHFNFNKVARPKAFAVREYLGTDPATGADRYTEHREEQPLGYSVFNDANRALYGEAILNYDRTFGDHNITGMALFNRREFVNLTSNTSINNLPERRQGVAGRATYGYKNKYFGEMNFGYNGSENFPAGKRYGFFPSVSAGWIVSGEEFWKSEFFSYLKLRASHGQVGSDRIGGRRFLFLTNLNTIGGAYRFGDGQQSWNGMTENQIGTEDVSWEVATKTNIGIDANFFKNKFSVQFDIFNEDRTGILIQRAQVPDYVGFLPNSIQYGNLGQARNRGFDAMFELKDQSANGFFYAVRGNFTFAKNKVLENDEPNPRYPYLTGKGIAIDQPFGLVALGLFQNEQEIKDSPKQNFMEQILPGDIKYRDVNNDGVIDIDDQVPIGYPRTPEIMFGFGSTVGFKGFEFSLFFTGVARSSMFLEGRSIYPFAEGLGIFNIMNEYHDNRWTGPGSTGIYPAVREYNSQNNYRRSTLWQKDASYLRLRNAEIAYMIPQTFTKKIGINQIRAFINGTNLYTWDRIKVIDPESNDGTGSYPIQRNINLGVQVNF